MRAEGLRHVRAQLKYSLAVYVDTDKINHTPPIYVIKTVVRSENKV